MYLSILMVLGCLIERLNKIEEDGSQEVKCSEAKLYAFKTLGLKRTSVPRARSRIALDPLYLYVIHDV